MYTTTKVDFTVVNFINILFGNFCTNVFCAAFLYLHFGFVTEEMLRKVLSHEKFVHKKLMKLTPGGLCYIMRSACFSHIFKRNKLIKLPRLIRTQQGSEEGKSHTRFREILLCLNQFAISKFYTMNRFKKFMYASG